MRFLKKDAVRDLQVLKTLTSTTDVCKTCQNSQFFCFGSVVVEKGQIWLGNTSLADFFETPQVSGPKHRAPAETLLRNNSEWNHLCRFKAITTWNNHIKLSPWSSPGVIMKWSHHFFLGQDPVNYTLAVLEKLGPDCSSANQKMWWWSFWWTTPCQCFKHVLNY